MIESDLSLEDDEKTNIINLLNNKHYRKIEKQLLKKWLRKNNLSMNQFLKNKELGKNLFPFFDSTSLDENKIKILIINFWKDTALQIMKDIYKFIPILKDKPTLLNTTFCEIMQNGNQIHSELDAMNHLEHWHTEITENNAFFEESENYIKTNDNIESFGEFDLLNDENNAINIEMETFIKAKYDYIISARSNVIRNFRFVNSSLSVKDLFLILLILVEGIKLPTKLEISKLEEYEQSKGGKKKTKRKKKQKNKKGKTKKRTIKEHKKKLQTKN